MMALPSDTGRPPRARNAKSDRALIRVALSLLLLGPAGACSGPWGVEGDMPDRETFIAVYVDLRMAAMDNRAQEIHPAERDSILEAYGVDADGLVAFADSHGRNVRYMAELWAEVEELINQALEPEPEPDTEVEDSVGDRP